MIGLSRLKRAISDVPPGGMQTGDHKVKLKLCDAQRIEVEYAALISERDAALAQNAELVAQVGALREDNKKLKERNRKLDVDLLKALFYAPSSPVSAQKAQEIEVWYGKFKQVVLAKNSGESADQYAEKVRSGKV